MWVANWNIGIVTLNLHYLWEAKMLDPYIKHGTFLWNLMIMLKPSKDIDFLRLKTKTNNI
jgi:hypothetical protein